eukprot:gene2268-2570_t
MAHDNWLPLPTIQEVLSHFENTTYVDPRECEWSCVDGRSQAGELATAGGDAGEFLLALAIAAQTYNITPDDVSRLFNEFMEVETTSFYLHTDRNAEDRLIGALVNKYGNEIFPSPFVIENATVEQQPLILELVGDPSYIGCGHIRLMVQNPEIYQIDRGITTSFLQSFFRSLWNDTTSPMIQYHKSDFIILEGEHHETAIITMKISKKLVDIHDPVGV